VSYRFTVTDVETGKKLEHLTRQGNPDIDAALFRLHRKWRNKGHVVHVRYEKIVTNKERRR
jgi:hypothetical protein